MEEVPGRAQMGLERCREGKDDAHGDLIGSPGPDQGFASLSHHEERAQRGRLVYLEHRSGALYLDKRSDTELYGRVFDRLTVDAQTPDQTRQLLAKARAEI